MIPRARAAAIALAVLAGAACAAPSLAQTGLDGAPAPAYAGQAEGRTVERVEVILRRGSGNAARDDAIIARLESVLAPVEGQAFSRSRIEAALAGPRSRIGTGSIHYMVADASNVGSVALRVEVNTVASEDAPPRLAFPTIHRDDRSYLTAILGGGFGVYSDSHPWFGRPDLFTQGNPFAGSRPGRRTIWTEGYVEAGLAGAAQIGGSPWYAYGALTGMTSWSLGQDIFRDDDRALSAIERAYAGLLYVDPDTGNSFNISAGRQNVTLNDGFLIHFVRGSANIGERGATYLGPRNYNDFSVVTDAHIGGWSLKGFHIDPDELQLVDGKSTFAGANLRYAFTPDLSADLSFITVPDSQSTYVVPGSGRLPREGLRTVAGHVKWRQAFGVDGLWLESELAHQSHQDFDMSARAAYGTVGYRFNDLPWKPSISYRYAHASGDDPSTSPYERYDPLLSTGFGNWLQGMSFGKITTNSNLAAHRIQINVEPKPGLNVTFDWHGLRAPELNNLGSNPALSVLSSHAIGNEFTLTARWALSRNWYFQGVASHAVPGKALRDVGADDPWTTFQASLYWTF